MMKKFSFLLFIGVVLPPDAMGQDQHVVDSLLHQLKNHYATKSELNLQTPSLYDTTAANINYQLAKAYMNDNPVKSLEYVQQSLLLSEKIPFKKSVARAYNMMGALFSSQGNNAKALQLFKKALSIRIELDDKKGIASTNNNIGVIYDNLGNKPEALKYYFAALKMQEKIGDEYGMASSYNNIAIVLDNEGNYKKALHYHYMALELRKKLGNPDDIAASYTNIGVVYKEQDQYPEALKNQFASLKIAMETGDKKSMLNTYNNIATTYGKQSEYAGTNPEDRASLIEKALNYSFSSLRIAEEIDDKSGLTNCYINIGVFYTDQNRFEEAEQYLQKGLDLSLETSNMEKVKYGYEGLSNLYKKLAGQPTYSFAQRTKFAQQALNQYMSFITYRDSLDNKEYTKKITQQQMQYEFDKKDVADSLKFAKETEIETIKLQKQKIYTYGGLLGIIITTILLFFVYRNYNREQIANKKLKEALDQLVKSEKMAAFGIMAARVSHEIQNPLNFVNNFSDLSQEMVKEVLQSHTDEEKKENAEQLIANLQKINEHGRRVAEIVKKLQEHSRKGTAQEFFENKK